LFLDVLHKLDDSFTILAQITSSRCTLEKIPIKFVEMIINVSTSQMTTVILFKNVHLWVCKPTGKNTQFRMSKVNKKNISWIRSIKFIFTEHTI